MFSIIEWQIVFTLNRFSYAVIYYWNQKQTLYYSDLLINDEVHSTPPVQQSGFT